jgi:hypothetical protein
VEVIGTNLNSPALAIRRRSASNSTGQKMPEIASKHVGVHFLEIENEA